MPLMKDIPLVEWMPLDGLVQQWATFASHSTRERAFVSTRWAFAALEQETVARRFEEEAHSEAWPASMQDALSCAFEQLQASALSWLRACERLDTYRRHDLPSEEEQSEQEVLLLLAESYEHLLYVACLSVRLVRRLHASLDEPLRAALCPLEMLERKEQP